jgi:hypothetical protein
LLGGFVIYGYTGMHLREKQFLNLLVFLLYLICFAGITEIAIRIFFKDVGIPVDEKNMLYRYDEKLGWFPVKNRYKMNASRFVEVEHNSRGFRDSEHIVGTHPRIVFLGDSFVWGYDVEKQERFTEKLAAKFANLSIYNLGVSGYGTDQEFLLLTQHYDFYKPNIVFLVFSDTDQYENSHNNANGKYFKPYFIANGDSLTLKGVPVPKSWRHFIKQHDVLSYSFWFRALTRLYFKYMEPPSLELNDPTYAIITNMHRFIKARGAKFIVGLQGVDPALKKYLKDNNIPFVDLSNSYVYPDNGRHWTPEGHALVSEIIYNYLRQERYLEKVNVNNKSLLTDAGSAALRPHR